MDFIARIAEALRQSGATDAQVTQNDANTEYERQHRISCVYEGRAFDLKVGLVRQHGGVSE